MSDEALAVTRTLTGKSKIAGVFGYPVDHSRSPRLHGFWRHPFMRDFWRFVDVEAEGQASARQTPP